jgi:hypothetical protein
MKAYRLFFEPDRAVPQFKRLRFEEVEVPLRDVRTRGCHPVGACHWRGSPKRDTSHAAEAVVNRLNEDDARVSVLKDFGYSHDLHTTSPPSRYAYGGSWQYREPSLADQLRALGKEVYFVRDLAFKELFKIAWERLKAGWNGAVARSMLTKRFYEFNELRRFLKSKDASITLRKRDAAEGDVLRAWKLRRPHCREALPGARGTSMSAAAGKSSGFYYGMPEFSPGAGQQ